MRGGFTHSRGRGAGGGRGRGGGRGAAGQRLAGDRSGDISRSRRSFRERGSAGNKMKYADDNPEYRTAEEKTKDRKLRRRQERVTQRQKRIRAQEMWSQQRRAARAARMLERQKKMKKNAEKDTAQASKHTTHQGGGKKIEKSEDHKKRKGETRVIIDEEQDFMKKAKRRRNALWSDEEEDEQNNNNNKKGSSESRKRIRTDTVHNDDSGRSGATSSSSSSSAAAAVLQRFQRTRRADVPPHVLRVVHGCVNKLTMTNVVDITREVAEVFQGGGSGGAVASRRAVLACLMDEIDRWGSMETEGVISSLTTVLPFAGLMRGLQLLGGDIVSADTVEQLASNLHRHVQQGDENGGNSSTMLVSLLYRLSGVDAMLVLSLLRYLLRQGEEEASHDDAEPETRPPPLSERVLCAASCALTLLRACGEKLLKEMPTEMDRLVQHARMVAGRLHGREGAARYAALVQVMLPILRGRSTVSKRNLNESDAPIEAMIQLLKTLLPHYVGNGAREAHNQRVLGRMIQTAHSIGGISFDQLISPDKPPQWWSPGVMASYKARDDGDEGSEGEEEEEEEGEEEEEESDDDEVDNDNSDEEYEEARAAAKKRDIERMRAEERAVSGQRFNTQHTRDIFRILASSADDLEAFTMLMHRDPGYTRFQDVCKVVLQCCVQEKQYNPFYASVMERFCHARRACRPVLQFAMWDYFKSVRMLSSPDVCGFLNMSCFIADLMENEVMTLSALRGLDLEETNKTIGLLTRMIMLRILLRLTPRRFTTLFFGGDGRVALDFQTDTSALRTSLEKILELYFDEGLSNEEEEEGKEKARMRRQADVSSRSSEADTKWLKAMYDVVAAGTPFDIYRLGQTARGDEEAIVKLYAEFQKRVRVARKALQQGIW